MRVAATSFGAMIAWCVIELAADLAFERYADAGIKCGPGRMERIRVRLFRSLTIALLLHALLVSALNRYLPDF